MNAPFEFTETSRCLSLTQPWATLVAIGEKRYETRSWSTSWRGWIAIHAAKGFPNDCRELCLQEPFCRVLKAAGIVTLGDLPRGQVIAIAYLGECYSTNTFQASTLSRESAFGDYGPDRFAWKLEAAQRIKPFDAKGALGIWRLPRAITPADFMAEAT